MKACKFYADLCAEQWAKQSPRVRPVEVCQLCMEVVLRKYVKRGGKVRNGGEVG